MTCSMSRKGNCMDNAPSESWFGSFKNERVYGERFETRDEMKAMSSEYIEVFSTGSGCTRHWATSLRASF